MTLRIFAFALMAVLALTGLTQAAEPRQASADDQNIEAAEAIAPFEALELSARLARLGQARSDPWLLATAARIRASNPVRLGHERAQTQVNDGAPLAAQGADLGPEAWNGSLRRWLDEAEVMADGDEGALAFIASVRALEFKGRAGGPLVSLSRLSGGQTQRFSERFTPGRPAVVYVEGDGDAPLAVTVTAGDVSVCQSNGPGDVKLCTWTARSPGDYRVEVRNLGTVANRYAYGTN
jgi:hypothetical protein